MTEVRSLYDTLIDLKEQLFDVGLSQEDYNSALDFLIVIEDIEEEG